MNEQQWLTSEDPARMIWHLDGFEPICVGEWAESNRRARTISDRKLRLFACRLCRIHVTFPASDQDLRAVEVAEWYAEGGSQNTRRCRWFPTAVMTDVGYLQIAEREAGEQTSAASLLVMAAVAPAPESMLRRLVGEFHGPTDDEGRIHRRYAALLREIVGNPFRTFALPKSIGSRACFHFWSGQKDVHALADSAYAERTPDGWLDPVTLSVLADAMEDHGCGDEDGEPGLLDHLRSPGPHAPGCWALDIVLGKS